MKKTSDTLFNGKVVCRQHQNGYRFSIDSILLAHFAESLSSKWRVLDLCCGCGVIGFILAYRYPRVQVTGLELQQQLAELAIENSRENVFADRYTLLQGDACHIEQVILPESFDAVFCNPPYRKIQTGRVNFAEEAMIARHEWSGTLNDFIKAAAFAVKNKGRLFFVYPAVRMATIIATMEQYKISVKRIQLIYSYPESQKATIILMEGVKNGGEQCDVLAPFYIYQEKNGEYTDQMAQMYR